MRSAIYYPSLEIADPSLLRSTLLMWDELHVIAPFEGIEPACKDINQAKIWDLIGRVMIPDEPQKLRIGARQTKKATDASLMNFALIALHRTGATAAGACAIFTA